MCCFCVETGQKTPHISIVVVEYAAVLKSVIGDVVEASTFGH